MTQQSHSQEYASRNVHTRLLKDMDENIQSNSICHSPEVATTQMPGDSRMSRYSVGSCTVEHYEAMKYNMQQHG